MLKRNKKVAVLGCGPSGLFAAHALTQNGWKVQIFSKARPSHLYGAQYLHAPIPGLTNPSNSATITYRLDGTVEAYREKVYGPLQVQTSVESLTRSHQAWDIRQTYDRAYNRYADDIHGCTLTPEALLGGTFDSYKYVVNSIPMDLLCHDKVHQFHAASIWAMGDAPDRGQYAPYQPELNSVICSGSRDVGWYRASNVFGHCTVEWPANRRPPLPGVAEVRKPIYTDCTCYRTGTQPFKFIPIGRYGQWSKGVLTHHAYTQAAQL